MKRVHFANNYLLNPTHPITVTLIGAGGTGSQVLAGLSRINHALQALGKPGLHISVFDPDVVTEANIGRQLFSQSDIGLNKAEVLVTRINRFFGVSCTAYPQLFESKYAPSNPVNYSTNIYISCVDTAYARRCISEALAKNNYGFDHTMRMYWMDFGNTVNSGQVILGTIGQWEQPESKLYETVDNLPTVSEMFDLDSVNEADSGPSCSLAEALSKQDLFINSTLANLGLAMLWKLLHDAVIDYRGVYLNLNSLNSNPIKL